MPHEWARKIYQGAEDENYSTRRWWHFFRSDSWIFSAIVAALILNVILHVIWSVFQMTLEWQNIFVVTAYGFLAYLPNGYGVIREENASLLIGTYYWVLLLGIPIGAHFMFWGFFWVFLVLFLLFLTAVLNAGLLTKFERSQDAIKEARESQKSRRPN